MGPILATAVASLCVMTPIDRPSVDSLSWMQGAWQCEIWGGTFEETWTAPRAGTMLGVGRHVVGDETKFMEFISIEPSEGGLTMWILLGSPSRGPKQGKPFRLTAAEPHKATFENPENDFPSKITYALLPEGRMSCLLEGSDGGKAKRELFDFRRVDR